MNDCALTFKLKCFLMLLMAAALPVFSLAQEHGCPNDRFNAALEPNQGNPISFTSVPPQWMEISALDQIPAPFRVEAHTACAFDSPYFSDDAPSGKIHNVGSYSEFVNALKIAVDNDIILLTNNVNIKPDSSFPNSHGVWEPFELNKAITIDGGNQQFKISFERGLPIELKANVTFKNLKLTMIPEVSIKATFVYVSDYRVVFDNVITKVDERVNGVPDPRPTIVAGYYGSHISMGRMAHIVVRNATSESTFEAIMAGNHNREKSTATIIDIEADDLRVTKGIQLRGLDGNKMTGRCVVNSCSKRISRYEADEDGEESILNFKNVSVYPEVTVINFDKVRLTGNSTQVKLASTSSGIRSAVINEGAELTFAPTNNNTYSLAMLGGPGTLVLPQNSTLTLAVVRNCPMVKVREWLFNYQDIMKYVVIEQEQPGDVMYFVNDKKYLKRNNQLELSTSSIQIENEPTDAEVLYLGEEVTDDGTRQTIKRSWKAVDFCQNQAIYTQTIVIVPSNSTAITDVDLADMVLYPNPVSDFFQLKTTGCVESVCVFGMNGALLCDLSLQSNFSVGHLPKGVYMVVVRCSNATKRFKIVKE